MACPPMPPQTYHASTAGARRRVGSQRRVDHAEPRARPSRSRRAKRSTSDALTCRIWAIWMLA
eukprot:6787445-Prymnesium_polylepis.1